MRRDRSQSELVKAYSASAGIPLRTAQHHARNGNPKFVGFANTFTPGAPQEPPAPGPADPLGRAAKAIEDTWKIAEQLRQRAAASPPAMADSLARAYQTALKSHREALAHHQRIELASGRLVPAARLAEIERDFIRPLGEVFRAMESELEEANPLAPHLARSAVKRWKESKLSPLLAAIASCVTVEKSTGASQDGGGA